MKTKKDFLKKTIEELKLEVFTLKAQLQNLKPNIYWDRDCEDKYLYLSRTVEDVVSEAIDRYGKDHAFPINVGCALELPPLRIDSYTSVDKT